MAIIQQIAFIFLLGVTGWIILRRIKLIAATISLGKDEDRRDQPEKRLATMVRFAFGQKRMFDRPGIGLMHMAVYVGFILINIEIIEIIIDGIAGTHRVLAGITGSFYSVLIGFFELLAVGVLVACAIFLVRRFNHVLRLNPDRHRELNGWPQLDGKLILVFEIVLMIAILSMNAADSVLQERGHPHYPQTGRFLFSQFLIPAFSGLSIESLVVVERFAWWFHIIGIFIFAIYVTYSKHLHIVLAFPNTYFARLKPQGEMDNMPIITNEVNAMLGLPSEAPETLGVPERFGAKDVQDLSWKNLMDAYSCTECGRCTAACPANITGKKLSPRKIMMDTRDRLEDVGRIMQANKGEFVADGKSLIGDYILEEEILACTTCQACVQECPVLINPLDIILQLRRHKVMDESHAPASWNMMFQNVETNQAPWKFSPGDRMNWTQNLES